MECLRPSGPVGERIFSRRVACCRPQRKSVRYAMSSKWLFSASLVIAIGLAGCSGKTQGKHGRNLKRNYEIERKRSEEHTSELQSRQYLVCRLLLEKKKKNKSTTILTY